MYPVSFRVIDDGKKFKRWSGTTLLAAAKTGRIGVGVELDPLYADLTVRCLADATGETAIHADSFESFEAVAKEREAEQ